MAFKPKKIEDPEEPVRLSAAELKASMGHLASTLIPTSTPPPKAPVVDESPKVARVEPVLMMSFKASRPFAKMLAEAAEPEGGLRRLVARVFHEAGYPVPPSELQPQRPRRTYDCLTVLPYDEVRQARSCTDRAMPGQSPSQ